MMHGDRWNTVLMVRFGKVQVDDDLAYVYGSCTRKENMAGS